MIAQARTDDERRQALVLLKLRGEEAELDHRRAELRMLLMHERRFNNGSQRATELEQPPSDLGQQRVALVGWVAGVAPGYTRTRRRDRGICCLDGNEEGP